MQNIIVITFKSGLTQYIPHNIEALNFISANFVDIENYIVVEPASQQKQISEAVAEAATQQKQISEVVAAPVDLSNLTDGEVIALAAALKSIEVETGGEFGTIDGAYDYKQNLTGLTFRHALVELDNECLTLADGSNAFFNIDTDQSDTHVCFNVTEGLYAVRQYVYDQAGLK